MNLGKEIERLERQAAIDALLDGIIVQSQQICMDVARFTDLEEFENVGMTATIRYCQKASEIGSTTHRIVFRDEIYDITSVDHMNFKKKCLKFSCRKVRR